MTYSGVHSPDNCVPSELLHSRAMPENINRYHSELDAFDMSDETKLELVQTLWIFCQKIMETKHLLPEDTSVEKLDYRFKER